MEVDGIGMNVYELNGSIQNHQLQTSAIGTHGTCCYHTSLSHVCGMHKPQSTGDAHT